MKFTSPPGGTRSRIRRPLACAAAVVMTAALAAVGLNSAQAAEAPTPMAKVANPFAGAKA